MRAIQSFWFAPLRKAREQSVAGFQSAQDFLLCWAFSAYLLRKQFGAARFFSDRWGCELAVKFKLPYESIEDTLAEFAANPGFWNAGKFQVYLAQSQPFLHFDLDFLLLRAISSAAISATLCGQHIESLPQEQFFYRDALKGLTRLPTFPKDTPKDLVAVNCGVFGGHDLRAIHLYANSCLEILQSPENRTCWKELEAANPKHLWKFSVAVEQLEARRSMESSPKGVAYLCPKSPSACDTAAEFGFLHLVGHGKADRHLIGMIAKEVATKMPDTFALIQEHSQSML